MRHVMAQKSDEVRITFVGLQKKEGAHIHLLFI